MGNNTINNIDENLLIDTLEKSVDNGDINAAVQLLYLYTQEDNLDIYRAKTLYYQLIQMCGRDDLNKQNVYFAFKHIFNFYFDNGYYTDAREVAYITFNSVNVEWAYDSLKTIGVPSPICTEEEKLKLKNKQEYREKLRKLIDEAMKVSLKKLNELTDSSQKNRNILLDAGFDEQVICKMTNQEIVFISTSFKTFEFINKESKIALDIDYSAATISIYKAVEIMLEKLFNKYLEYLKSNEKSIDTTKLDKYLTYKSGDIKFRFGTEFTCGKVLEFIGEKEKKYISPNYYEKCYKPHKYFCNFCKKCGIINPESYVQIMIEDMLQIIKLRNETAHRASISKEDAKQTFDILVNVTKFINKIYTDFNKVI